MPDTPETIRYTADVVVTTTDGRVLLIERGWDPHRGMWALPGGHVDLGETSRAAAARELAEEAGVYATEAELVQVGVWDAPGRDPRGRYVTVAYHLTVIPGTPIEAGDDATRAQWWPLSALPPLAFDHADIIAASIDASTGDATARVRTQDDATVPGELCVFCDIAAGQAPATVLREWDNALAIKPRSGVNDGHTLVIPRIHVATATENPAVTGATAACAAEYAADLDADLNLITSDGPAATQTVFHLHWHIVPRTDGDGLPLPWTPQHAARAAAQKGTP